MCYPTFCSVFDTLDTSLNCVSPPYCPATPFPRNCLAAYSSYSALRPALARGASCAVRVQQKEAVRAHTCRMSSPMDAQEDSASASVLAERSPVLTNKLLHGGWLCHAVNLTALPSLCISPLRSIESSFCSPGRRVTLPKRPADTLALSRACVHLV